MRYSSRREAIMNIMRSTHSHPDAEWVYNRLREEFPSVSLGTVYRNLRELSAAGELATLETEFTSLRFDADTTPHSHFVCKDCGKISDLYGYADVTELLESVGYRVDDVKTVVYGICPKCYHGPKHDVSLS